MLEIGNRKIKRILIVDDDPEARDSHEYLIEALAKPLRLETDIT